MKIAHRTISAAEPPLVIAEIGINHGGDLKVAKEMVDLAHEAGCEIIKHQTHILEDEMTEEAKSIFPPNADVSIWEVMERCSLSLQDDLALKKHTEQLGMIYISTPFSRKAADFLVEAGVPAFKISSGEADNLPLLKHVAAFGKPIILSTGMQTVVGMRPAVEILEAAGVDYALLQCTNLYPSPPETVSLKGIAELREAFPKAEIGFSDHSIGPTMVLAAIALGACIVERHYTDSHSRKGPDIPCSMDPAELKLIIDRGREIHRALGNPKRRLEAEKDVYRFARASVVADRDLPAGTVLTAADIWVRRPGNGAIAAYDFDKVVGKTLKTAKTHNQQLDWADFK